MATIARDEAAHYDFFLELARIHLYYFPEESLQALVTVLRNFTMPAASIVPNYDQFIQVLYEAQLFGPLAYGRDVAKPALTALGITSIKAIEAGILKLRETPDPAGDLRARPIPEGCSFDVLEATVRRLFDRFHRYEEATGLSAVHPTHFVPNSWTPRSAGDSRDAASRPEPGAPR